MSSSAQGQGQDAGEKLILLGTHGDHIHSVLFNPSTKSLRLGQTKTTNPHPSWLVRHPIHSDIIYSNGWVEGQLIAYRLTDSEGTLETLAQTATDGKGPTHLAIMPGATGLVAAQYGTGATTHIPLLPSGLFPENPKLSHYVNETIPSPHPRQEAPHAHQVIILPGGQGGEAEAETEILTPDLGSDRVLRTRLVGDKLEKVGEFTGFEQGDGPRHAVVHPKGTHLYTLGELSSVLITHSFSSPASPLSRHLILPPYDTENNNGPKMLACEIILLPSLNPGGKHLLIATNRDSPNPKGDAIALFSVSDEDGSKVERVADQPWIEGVGNHVRGMAADQSGKWVIMAGRDGGGVKMFERVGKEGLNLQEVAHVDLEKVVCPLWIE